jgi:hypothetical protein
LESAEKAAWDAVGVTVSQDLDDASLGHIQNAETAELQQICARGETSSSRSRQIAGRPSAANVTAARTEPRWVDPVGYDLSPGEAKTDAASPIVLRPRSK